MGKPSAVLTAIVMDPARGKEPEPGNNFYFLKGTYKVKLL
jgi:hypothetical protein